VPHGTIKVIEVVPVGPFDESKAPNLAKLCAYASAFFAPCEVRLAPDALTLAQCSGAPVPATKAAVRAAAALAGGPREGGEGQLQLECADVFAALQRRKKARDVLCCVAVTMADLYPTKVRSPFCG